MTQIYTLTVPLFLAESPSITDWISTLWPILGGAILVIGAFFMLKNDVKAIKREVAELKMTRDEELKAVEARFLATETRTDRLQDLIHGLDKRLERIATILEERLPKPGV